jgi:copper chaperone CopZ
MSDKTTRYAVQGMKCGGCEASAREAVTRLPGCVDAHFDFRTGTGVVTGDVAPDTVVAALAAVGYRAALASG